MTGKTGIKRNAVPINNNIRSTNQSSNKSCISNTHQVDSIIGQQVINGTMKYRVQWTGCNINEATWEPLHHVQNCNAYKRWIQQTSNKIISNNQQLLCNNDVYSIADHHKKKHKSNTVQRIVHNDIVPDHNDIINRTDQLFGINNNQSRATNPPTRSKYNHNPSTAVLQFHSNKNKSTAIKSSDIYSTSKWTDDYCVVDGSNTNDTKSMNSSSSRDQSTNMIAAPIPINPMTTSHSSTESNHADNPIQPFVPVPPIMVIQSTDINNHELSGMTPPRQFMKSGFNETIMNTAPYKSMNTAGNIPIIDLTLNTETQSNHSTDTTDNSTIGGGECNQAMVPSAPININTVYNSCTLWCGYFNIIQPDEHTLSIQCKYISGYKLYQLYLPEFIDIDKYRLSADNAEQWCRKSKSIKKQYLTCVLFDVQHFNSAHDIKQYNSLCEYYGVNHKQRILSIDNQRDRNTASQYLIYVIPPMMYMKFTPSFITDVLELDVQKYKSIFDSKYWGICMLNQSAYHRATDICNMINETNDITNSLLSNTQSTGDTTTATALSSMLHEISQYIPNTSDNNSNNNRLSSSSSLSSSVPPPYTPQLNGMHYTSPTLQNHQLPQPSHPTQSTLPYQPTTPYYSHVLPLPYNSYTIHTTQYPAYQ